MSSITSLAAWEMADAVRKGNLSPVEVLDAHLAAIESQNPKLNAITEVDAERARDAALAAEAAVRRGGKLGSLHGVPITIKSSIDVAGLPAECGSLLRAGLRATTDAP